MDATESHKKEAVSVSYLCSEQRVERKKIYGIKNTGKTVTIEIFTAIANEKIMKCDFGGKENRELIARKGDKVTFFEWCEQVFIKGTNNIVFLRNSEKIKPHLSTPLPMMSTFELYEASIDNTKAISGFSFGLRLNRREDFIIWIKDMAVLTNIDHSFGDENNKIDVPGLDNDDLSLQITPSQNSVQRSDKSEDALDENSSLEIL